MSGESCLSNFDVPAGEGSCCQETVCLIPCPEPTPEPPIGYGIAIIIFIVISCIIGLASYNFVRGKTTNYFVAGRALPLWVVSITLAAQGLDSNAVLGNADLSYKYHFYDGAVIPMGLGFSLILNGIFFAKKINEEKVLTLPDVFAKKYGKVVEVVTSLISIISFMMLLAGNLVGMGAILGYTLNISDAEGIWISAVCVWLYTTSGGLLSVAFTDVAQGAISWLGLLVFVFYTIKNADLNAPQESIGFPGYIYPDGIGEGGVCDKYNGVPCNVTEDACCYNPENEVADNGAYPFGDLPVFPNQLTDPSALFPFPNAILWDWSTIFILSFGNLAALDFQARCLGSKTPQIATIGCFIAGLITLLVGIPFAYMGAITRVYYGPDSVHAEFATDTCSPLLGLGTCGLWLPDAQAFLKYVTNQSPAFLGGWCLLGIVGASMSTSDGAILAMGTVFCHNVLEVIFPFVTKSNKLTIVRLSTIPFTVIATLIAAYYRSSHSAGATGYLLIVAFDIMFASVVVALFGAFYTSKPSPNAGLFSVLAGCCTRIILEFALPKDGFLLMPFPGDEFLDFGKGASLGAPLFVDDPNQWDPSVEVCDQVRFNDYTGIDSLVSPIVALVVFIFFQVVEKNGPLFTLPGMTPYTKVTEDEKDVSNTDTSSHVENVDEAIAVEEN